MGDVNLLTIAGSFKVLLDKSIDLGLDPRNVIDEASMIDLSIRRRCIASFGH